ncbi:MAG: iron-sulfur cluster assembly protein [Patescibacteria group bacterium]
MKVVTKKQIENKLKKVLDPELNISIMDLGLVYDVAVKKNSAVLITMTLTTMGCPLFSLIEQEIQNKLYQLGCQNVKINLTFDPPWSMEKMSDNARAQLGM